MLTCHTFIIQTLNKHATIYLCTQMNKHGTMIICLIAVTVHQLETKHTYTLCKK